MQTKKSIGKNIVTFNCYIYKNKHLCNFQVSIVSTKGSGNSTESNIHFFLSCSDFTTQRLHLLNQPHSINLNILGENSTTVVNTFSRGRLDYRISHVKDKNTYSLETNVSIVFMLPLNSTKHQSILLIFYFLLKNSISIEYFTQNDFFPLKSKYFLHKCFYILENRFFCYFLLCFC